jgi:putative ABC transport system permease protein
VGIYSVVCYITAQRTQEMDVRMALGAQRGDVLRMVLGAGAKMTAAGVALGLLASFGLTRLIATLLVSATDPITLVAVSSLLSLVAFAACYVPARRATRIDPLVALRYE